MKIIKFSIRNYRSISNAKDLPIKEKSILIGPNNEGKSNILDGLVLTLRYLTREKLGRTRRGYIGFSGSDYREIEYLWDRDYPLNLQRRYPNGSSEFKVEFELNDNEKKEFSKTLKSNFSSNLILQLKFGKNDLVFDIVIPGKAKKYLEKKYDLISVFLKEHISLQYIPAVRATNYTLRIIEDLLDEELSVLDKDQEYIELIKKIGDKQKPILENISNKLQLGISDFLGEVKKVEINSNSSLSRAIRRSTSVFIDDGHNTEISQKGEGVKSLFAISLVRYISKQSLKNQNLILAIEEPESHLHPSAIHKLAKVLTDISKEHQVIITTHSPLLADKARLENNLIVNKSRAKPAQTISDIRDILGIKVQDNLTSAQLVLICEGSEDKKILDAWLSTKSQKIKKAINNRVLVISDMGGGTKLNYFASFFQVQMCEIFAFLDDDDCGRSSFDTAKNEGHIDNSNARFSKCRGRKKSEIEDMIEPRLYISEIEKKYSIRIDPRIFGDKNNVWSDRLESIFSNAGVKWDDQVESDLKKILVEKVQKFPSQSIRKGCSGPIDDLVRIIDEKLYE